MPYVSALRSRGAAASVGARVTNQACTGCGEDPSRPTRTSFSSRARATASGWLHDLPVLGVPGANSWQPEWEDQFADANPILVVVEPGDPGQHRLDAVGQTSALSGRVFAVRLDGVKDLCELHQGQPADFEAAWQEAIDGAEPYVDVVARRDSEAPGGRKPVTVRVADIMPEPVTWLWEPYVPLGKLTLLDGDARLGKSWMTLALAAWRGRDVEGREIQGPDTLDDVETVRRALERQRPRLLVIDPLVLYLGAGG